MTDNRPSIFPWSQADLDRLFYLRDVKFLSWREIAAEMGRKTKSCQSRYAEILNSRKRKSISGAKSIEKKAHPSINTNCHTSITAMIFGDPLPGRSALDKMKSGG